MYICMIPRSTPKALSLICCTEKETEAVNQLDQDSPHDI